nr:helix-turn-helix domain-containing protein [Mycolicibacterium gilvum]
MTLRKGGEGLGGLADAGDLERPGGRGHRLSFAERFEIDRGLQAGRSYAEIGRELGRDRSVIAREVKRNCLPDGRYHALMAHAAASQKARRPKKFKLDNPALCALIAGWMDEGWSPKLISQVLAETYAGDKRACHSICVSPGWSKIGPPFGRTEGVICDQGHSVVGFGKVGGSATGGDVFG